MNLTSTRHSVRLTLKSLYPISGPCSFSNTIACCITCRRNGTGGFSLMSPVTSLLKSNVILHPAAPPGLVCSSKYEIFFGIWISTQAIAISVFMLLFVSLSLPHCSFSLWKHFTSIRLVHRRTWSCTFLHTLQLCLYIYLVFFLQFSCPIGSFSPFYKCLFCFVVYVHFILL